MSDTDNVTFNRPADRLIDLINNEYSRMDGKDLNTQNVYEIACKILRRRLGIDNFETKGKK